MVKIQGYLAKVATIQNVEGTEFRSYKYGKIADNEVNRTVVVFAYQ